MRAAVGTPEPDPADRPGRVRGGIVATLLLAGASILATACGSTGSTGSTADATGPTSGAPTSTTNAGGTTAPAATTPPTPDTAAPGTALVDFRDPVTAGAWTTVNDPVMGGRSTSAVTADPDGLVFAGVVSLENNGGFASARGPDDPDLGRRAAGAATIRVRARGDGQTYVLQTRAPGQRWSYVQRFTTTAGELGSFDLPVEQFEAVDFFLEPAPQAPPRLDPSTISQFTVYILDKQAGPFTLTLVGIDAVP